MVLEKVLTQLSLPESFAKVIEEFAGIYRFPGYKKLIESLKPILDQAPKRWGARWEVVSPRSIGNPLFEEMDVLAMRSPLY